MDTWNKDEPYNKGEYRQYKIRTDDSDTVHFKTYYALELLHEGEEYEILFPAYDWKHIGALTGIQPVEGKA